MAFTVLLQAPDAASIRAAITEEARRRGIEHNLREERPPAAQQRRSMGLPRQLLGSLGGVDDQLVQLLEQALDGQFSLANLRLSGSGEQQTETEEEVGVQPPVFMRSGVATACQELVRNTAQGASANAVFVQLMCLLPADMDVLSWTAGWYCAVTAVTGCTAVSCRRARSRS